jgi:phosphoserine phosphatase
MNTSQASYILVTISGADRPGITAALTNLIAKSSLKIGDIGQSVTHGFLSLSIVLRTNGDQNGSSSGLLKDLLFEAKNMGLSLDFKVLDSEMSQAKAKHPYVFSCVTNQTIPAQFLAQMSGALAKHNLNIQRINNTSTELSFNALDIHAASIEPFDEPLLKTQILEVSRENSIDIAIVKDDVFRHNKRLIVFDMDSTLIEGEVINELAEIKGVGEQVAAITKRAMNGEIDFDQSLIERVKLLKGLTQDQALSIIEHIKLTPGTDHFIKTVKSLGYKTAVISGGFTHFADHLRKTLGLDYAFANELVFEQGALTGEVKRPIVNGEQKSFLLSFLAQQESISLEQVVAIGDGANDLPMLAKAGMGIAFHAKEIVRQSADHHMSYGPMTTILSLLGIPKDYWENLTV